MKKLIAILLGLVLCTGCLWAAAEEPVTEEIPTLGLSFAYPREMVDATGVIGFGNTMSLGEGVYYNYLVYSAMTLQEFYSAEEEQQREKTVALFYCFAISDNRDFSAVTAVVGDTLNPENAMQIGKADSWTYYLYFMDNSGFADTLEAGYRDEYNTLIGMKDEIASAFTFSAPHNGGGDTDGRTLSFTVTDLDGNSIPSSEIFAQHEVTMVNIWATWCGPCVSELADLQAIHTRFLEKDCAVLGLLTDDDIQTARSLIKKNGITYQVVIAPDNFSNLFMYEAVPTSFFVDRNGVIIGSEIVGVQTNKYEAALEQLLKK